MRSPERATTPLPFTFRRVIQAAAALLFLIALSTSSAAQYLFNKATLTTGQIPSAIVNADVNGDGRTDLIVSNQNDNTISVFLGQINGTFGSKSDFSVGSLPLGLTTGDFNKDGKLDIVVSNSGDNSVSVLLGNGDGTFQSHTDYAVASFPKGIAAVDVNGDGKLDLVVACTDSNAVSVLLGVGDGTFLAHVEYSTGSGPTIVAARDFNSDGKIDLAVVDSLSAAISILLGNGDGTFQTHADFTGVGNSPNWISAADFNGDGKLDLAISDGEEGTINVFIYIGNGDGTFTFGTALETLTATTPEALTPGDFNGDGKIDLAVADCGVGCPLGAFSVFLGNGDGTFQQHVDYVADIGEPTGITTSDFNGDGKLDIAAVNPYANSVSVYIGNGDGTFNSKTLTQASGGGVAAGDFNHDGKLDLSVAISCPSNLLSTLIGNGDGTFQSPVSYAAGICPVSVSVADLNGDGNLDLVVVDNDGMLSVFLGNPDGSFQPAVSYSVGGNDFSGVVADFNLDGKPDFAVGSVNDSAVVVLLGNGDGTFQNPVEYPVAGGAFYVVTGDFNGDGKPDLAAIAGTQSKISILIGKGDGTFSPHTDIVGGLSPASLVAVDLNGDGKIDLADTNKNGISVFLGNGDGTFQKHKDYAAGYLALNPLSLLAADLNGDGKIDLIAGTTYYVDNGPHPFAFLAGNGDGTFQPQAFVLDQIGDPFVAADFNLDSSLDLAATTLDTLNGSYNVSVYLNNPIIGLYPTTLNFGTEALGSTSSLAVTVSNPGTAALSLSSLQTSGAFSQSNNCPMPPNTLQSNASCTVTVTFTPQTIGSISGGLILSDTSPSSPQSIALTGTGTAISLVPNTLNFGNVIVGSSSSPMVVTLTNVGSSQVNISKIALSGTNHSDFAEKNNCKRPLSAGQSCKISTVFTPKALGLRTASVKITDNGGGSPQSIPLSGTGIN